MFTGSNTAPKMKKKKTSFFAQCEVKKSWIAFLKWPLEAKCWRHPFDGQHKLNRNFENVSIDEKSESEIISKLYLKNRLFQRYYQSINIENIDHLLHSLKNRKKLI